MVTDAALPLPPGTTREQLEPDADAVGHHRHQHAAHLSAGHHSRHSQHGPSKVGPTTDFPVSSAGASTVTRRVIIPKSRRLPVRQMHSAPACEPNQFSLHM